MADQERQIQEVLTEVDELLQERLPDASITAPETHRCTVAPLAEITEAVTLERMGGGPPN